jgi:hypothetical protein
MKTILVVLALWATIGCASSYREIQQADMVKVQVIKIDTIFRHPEKVKQLTWKDTDDIQYITYVSIYNELYSIGSSMYVMRKR